jgi:hypothetical protein
MVFPREADSDVLAQAVEGLRELAGEEQTGAESATGS